MPENLDDFLAHYGVKGMKWGVRKDRTKDSVPSERSLAKQAKRKAKSDDILKKAQAVQAQIDDVEKNGTHSQYMVKKYGPSMAVDTRAADMKFLLLHGNSKQQILAAEKRGLQASKDHFLADADAASKGKLTSKQKMLIGASVAVLTLAAVGAVGYHQGVKFDRAMNAIKPGESIRFDQFWKKMGQTELSRVSGISKDAFDLLDDTPITVPAGNIFKRVSTDPENSFLKNRVYAAFKDEDVTRYSAALPEFWKRWTSTAGAKTGHVVSLKAVEDVVSPSKKARVQSFIDILDQPIEGKGVMGSTVVKKGREWLSEELGFIDTSGDAKTVGLKTYQDFAMTWVQDSPLKGAYFDKIKAQGYNALIDDNDAGKLSDSPMLILDASKTLQRVGSKVLSESDIQDAKNKLVELANRH